MPEIKREITTAKARTDLVDFGMAKIPIGALPTYAKSNHPECNGTGWVKDLSRKMITVCGCALRRANKRLLEVGVAAFEEETRAKAQKEEARVQALEARAGKET